jgi:multidrug efflux system outer membrane protein
VIRSEHLLIAQNANIGAARAAMFPTISLTGLLGTISGGLSGLFTSGSFTRTIEPAVSYDIFNAGRSRANVRLAEANQQAAVATYEKTLQTAFREVADALAERGTINEQVSAQTAGAESAQVAARLSNARYRVGVGSFLDYLVNQRTAYTAQQALVTTRLNKELNLVELYRALGGGLT